MTKIFKYPLSLAAQTVQIYMPKRARILDLQNQREVPTLWAEVDPDAEEELRTFYVIPTGGEPVSASYLGTLQFADGDLVFHVYEERIYSENWN